MSDMDRRRPGWKLDSKRSGAWVRALPAMRLVAGPTLLDGYRWTAGSASGDGRESLEDAATSAEATGRKLLARSLRLLLPGERPARAITEGLRCTLRGMTAIERRELLRQLLREVEKGGGA